MTLSAIFFWWRSLVLVIVVRRGLVQRLIVRILIVVVWGWELIRRLSVLVWVLRRVLLQMSLWICLTRILWWLVSRVGSSIHWSHCIIRGWVLPIWRRRVLVVVFVVELL